MQMKGIDVSRYQGDIDFEQVKKSGIEFVIIKAGEWTEQADKFEQNYERAKAANMHIGFYWYCNGRTLDQISQEADACIAALKDKQFDFPIYMDMENKYQYSLGKQFCSDAVRTFCDKLEKAGYYAGLYTATSWLLTVIDDDVKKRYTLWVADWRGYCGYDGKYGMWQYGAGYVPGINGKTDLNILDLGYDTDYPGSVVADGVDLDYAYEDFPNIITSGGYNNYPKPEDEWLKDECKDVANTLNIRGMTPILSGDNWFLMDKTGKFTLETTPYARVNIYLVGGGEDGEEWYQHPDYDTEYFIINYGCRGGSVLKKEIYITGTVECQAIVAERGNPNGTTLKIGNDVYKCTDSGFIRRKATKSGNAKLDGGGYYNAESGANGILTPYGYVGSSGGGGGGYGTLNGQVITVGAGKGGVGAGDGGKIKCDGENAVNYGCGGGSAGFGGFPSDGDAVETHAGMGADGCIIFEILDGGACDGSPNKPPTDSGDGNCSCGCVCECPTHEFTCPAPSESSSECSKETNYELTYENGIPVEKNDSVVTSDSNNSEQNGENSGGEKSVKNAEKCNCSAGNSQEKSESKIFSCNCGGSGVKCVSYDVEKWGENWLLFNKEGTYTLNLDKDTVFKVYVVGGGCDGKDGLYYNKTAYGGDGGSGGYYCAYNSIEVHKGKADITVRIGSRNDPCGTSVVIENNEYYCNGSGSVLNSGGVQGISGVYAYRHAGNGTNGAETPFGFIGSSGGGGAAYFNSQTTSHGRGGLNAGNGGRIVSGRSSPGEKAVGYGCGGGGGAASPSGYCSGGKGRQGCVIITW